MLGIEPVLFGSMLAPMITEDDDPAVTSPTTHDTVPGGVSVHPGLEDPGSNVAAESKVSVTVIPVASDGPLLLATTVHWLTVPGTA